MLYTAVSMLEGKQRFNTSARTRMAAFPPENTVYVLVRMFLLLVTLAIVLVLPSFSFMMGLFGSACSTTTCIVSPCDCYACLFWDQPEMTWFDRTACTFGVVVGLACAVVGTLAWMVHPF